MVRHAINWRRLNFPHHTFGDADAGGCYELISSNTAAATPDPESSDIGEVPQLLRQGGVTRIILVHGTFAGNDIVGFVRQVARFSPSLAGKMNELGKRWFDEFVGELGNYTASYADCLSSLINIPSLAPIPVTRFEWSGENHHLGRASGAMSLLDSIPSSSDGECGRVLILAHSHGGNVVSMLSHLIAASESKQRAFFDATRLHYRNPITRNIDLPNWQRAKERLLDKHRHPLPLDVASFGTPLRYRFNADACPNLVHFVQHRPLNPEHPELAVLPRSIQELINAAGGDYVQQLGIVGTDFIPSILAWREWIVERRMRKMFERKVRWRDLIKNLKLGQRTSVDAATLLIDYPDSEAGWNRKLFGHGVYTCREWLPFHLREISDRFYRSPKASEGRCLRKTGDRERRP